MTLGSGGFAYVSELVRRRSAIVLEPGKEYLVEARLLPIAREQGVADVEALASLLRGQPEGALHQRVVDAMTTNETSWFRDNRPFTAFADSVLPQLLAARGRERRLAIWSAACSSGQEPYSLAMILADRLALSPGWSADILATDLSTEMLDRAREGRYSQLEVNRGLPAPMLVRHFERSGTQWQVKPALRTMVRFQQLNLAAPLPALPQMDVVFLRNVLIYFDAATKARVLGQVRRVLRPDGYLFLGGAETTLNVDAHFQRVTFDGATAYRLGGGEAAA